MSDSPPRSLIARLAPHEEKLRFLVVGVWNTAFNLAMLWIFERLLPYGPGSALARVIGVVGAKQVVLFVAWAVSVTQNLFTFKLLVFRTKGNWLKEFGRIFITYAGTFVVESVMIQVLSARFGLSLFIAKLPTVVVVMVLSYLGHKYFTFRTKEEALEADLEAEPEARV